MQKREERAQKIRELGALPEGAFESYQSYSSKKVSFISNNMARKFTQSLFTVGKRIA